MRTKMINVARTASVAVIAILATGCGAGLGPADSNRAHTRSSASAATTFDQKAVQRDLQVVVAAAGLTGGKVETGLGVTHEPPAGADTETRHKTAALFTRLIPCAVSWSPTDKQSRSLHAANPAGTQRKLEVMLSGLAARGWKLSTPSKETPVGDDGTYFMASYKKKGWLLNARHLAAPSLDQMMVIATEEACFSQLTSEEQALIEN